jgi:hypothetical protein
MVSISGDKSRRDIKSYHPTTGAGGPEDRSPGTKALPHHHTTTPSHYRTATLNFINVQSKNSVLFIFFESILILFNLMSIPK